MSSNGIKKIVVNLDALQMKAPKKQTKKRPTIVPNKLKDTFLKQVQHHKSLANAQKKHNVDANKYTDDFNSSIEYLNNIKKTMQPVHSDLPSELMESTITTTNIIPKLVDPISSPALTLTPDITIPSIQTPGKYAVDNDVPYGCLKNGVKQTFKNWTRNNRSSLPTPTPSTSFSLPTPSTSPSLLSSITTPSPSLPSTSPSLPSTSPSPSPSLPSSITTPSPSLPSSANVSIIEPINNTQSNNTNKSIPLTIIKRHVIGKSKKSRHVGVLIKNVNTRKIIISAHKDLKKTNINEVRNHLKNNGLLKVGTTAPIDLLRQTYEASILAGNINNKNEETLYHNFVNDKEI
jgi:hypothetical protein